MYYSQRFPYRRDSMPEKEKPLNNQEELSGFIFMCNRVTKPECYRFRVFGLPEWRKEDVEKIKPDTYLFLFDCDSKLLYGIYTATSRGKLGIEELAFGGKFPAQVKFKIHQDCLPLPESCFKHAIQDNYLRGSHKFSPELNLGQVESLLSLFRPLTVSKQIITPTSAPTLSMQYQTSENQLHLSACPLGVQNTYSVGNSGSSGKSVPEPQSMYQNIPYDNYYYQPECHSLMNMGTVYDSSSQSSLHTHQVNSNPQSNVSSYMVSMGDSYAQSLADRQHPYTLNPQSNFHSSTVIMSSSQAQSTTDSQYAHPNVLNPQPVGYLNPLMQSQASSSANVSYHYDRTGYQYIPEAVPTTAYPYQHTYNLNPHSNFHLSTVNMSSSQAQPITDRQYVHQNVLNPQPVGYVNPIMQSQASSSSNVPYHYDQTGYQYIPEAVASTAYPSQGPGGNEHYGSSLQTQTDISYEQHHAV